MLLSVICIGQDSIYIQFTSSSTQFDSEIDSFRLYCHNACGFDGKYTQGPYYKTNYEEFFKMDASSICYANRSKGPIKCITIEHLDIKNSENKMILYFPENRSMIGNIELDSLSFRPGEFDVYFNKDSIGLHGFQSVSIENDLSRPTSIKNESKIPEDDFWLIPDSIHFTLNPESKILDNRNLTRKEFYFDLDYDIPLGDTFHINRITCHRANSRAVSEKYTLYGQGTIWVRVIARLQPDYSTTQRLGILVQTNFGVKDTQIYFDVKK
jgi:hypothetical protein